MNRLFFDNTIGALIEKMHTKEISPVAVLAASLENIAEFQPRFFPFEVFRDGAWKPREPRPPMDGPRTKEALFADIPIAVKDMYNTYDFPTQMGSPLWKGFEPGNDARAVYHLKHQGAVIVGKTVTAEFAVHALDKTLNPRDVTKGPGTSSSGSAVAVALGIVPFATGTQTAGSIVRPSSFCGVYGCKPSFGTIPRTGTLKTTDSLDTLGFLAIHQEDLRRGFEGMRVRGFDYPISNAALSDVGRQTKQAGRPWRIGFVKTHTWELAPQYAKDAMVAFVEKLGKDNDFHVVEATLPERSTRAHVIHETIYNKALSYYFKDEYKQSDFVSKVMQDMIANGHQIQRDEYARALDEQMEFIYDMDEWFADYDILISLSTAGEAPLRDVTETPDPALMWTLAHLPVVSVPQFRSSAGLPFGFQAAARKYNDLLLFNFLDELRVRDVIPVRGGLEMTTV